MLKNYVYCEGTWKGWVSFLFLFFDVICGNKCIHEYYHRFTALTVFEVIVMEMFATLSISLLLLQLMIQARDNMDWRYWRWDPNMSDYAVWWVRSNGVGVARWFPRWFTGYLTNIFRGCEYLNVDSFILNVLSSVEWVLFVIWPCIVWLCD